MTDDQEMTDEHEKPLPPWLVALGTFAAKVAIFLMLVYFAIGYVTAPIAAKFSGGRQFWNSVEEKLVKFADQPDLPPEKRARIIGALEKIGDRYRPYIQALTGENRPGAPSR